MGALLADFITGLEHSLDTRARFGHQDYLPMLRSRRRAQQTSARKTSLWFGHFLPLTSTRRIWDPQTGETLHILTHNHIVRAVAFPIQVNPQCVATGAQDKTLKIFDLSRGGSAASLDQTNGTSPTVPSTTSEGHEIGAGQHGGSIKSIVWNVDYNVLTTACEDKMIRWWDLRTQRMITSVKTGRDITSCELSTNKAEDNDPGILSVAAGQSCFFFDAGRPGELIKQVNFDHEVASVAINPTTGRFVTGGGKDTWVRVWDFAQEKELGMILTSLSCQGR